MGSTYRPWYVVVAVLSVLIGIALIGCAAETKVLSSDVSDEVFHLWIGIPVSYYFFIAFIVSFNLAHT